MESMGEFLLEKRIYYHDTDCGGVVYYANYLKHLEEARTEYFRSKGIELQQLAERGVFFVVAKAEIEYKAPARYQDTIRIFTGVEKARAAAMIFLQRIMKNDTTLVEARITLLCVNKDFRRIAIPEEIRRSLK